MYDDQKYVTFKGDEYRKFLDCCPDYVMSQTPIQIPDAVVIRRQDVFSPPALDAYANSILVALSLVGDTSDPRLVGLKEIADYFHEQAEMAWHTDRRIPD